MFISDFDYVSSWINLMVRFSLHAYVHAHVHVHVRVLCYVCEVSTSVTRRYKYVHRMALLSFPLFSFLYDFTLTSTFPATITANYSTICYCMVCHVMSCHVMLRCCLMSDISTSDSMSCPTTALRSIPVMPMLTCNIDTSSIGIS
jgi:hypothetical protein